MLHRICKSCRWGTIVGHATLGAASMLAATPLVAQQAVSVAPGVYAVMGRGGVASPSNAGRVANSAFIVGPRGVVVIDSGVSARHGETIIAAVREVTSKPIRLLVLTHPGQDVVFGAAAFQAQRVPVLMHSESAALMAARCSGCLDTLTTILGADEMAGTRVVRPDRLIDATQPIDVIGRPLSIVALNGSSAPGALAVMDQTTRTLIAGSVVSIDSVPDMRDGDPRTWSAALKTLKATRCAHLVPAFGRIGSCADIGAMERYFGALDSRVRELLRAGAGLADVRERADLAQFAHWDRYGEQHAANANREYLRLERVGFE
jgi:glyoxylase-like metal-dependent hydrolase (beta-lactamase superfamily II)